MLLQNILKNFKENQDVISAKDVIEYFKTQRTNDEIVLLIEALAGSGERLPMGKNVADIPSTGGPSSLSTILCPLYLAASGLEVRKLGVSGRPAGGIDVLYQIPAYRTTFSVEEIKKIVSTNASYFHFESGGAFAPLDATLFNFRKELGAINVPQLAIASLLSKKVSVGVSFVNLDVRAAEFGNFGQTFDECLENAQRFCEVAALCEVTAKCTVSDASIPYQPYIGRREALIAINNLLYGHAEMWLQNHNAFCQQMCRELLVTHNQKFCVDNTTSMTLTAVRDVFETNLKLQGSSLDAFKDVIMESGRESIIESKVSGRISYNLNCIRNSIVSAQTNAAIDEYKSKYPDPIGVELLSEPNSYIEKGTPILRLRYRTNYNFKLETNNWYFISEKKTKDIQSRKVQVI